MEIEINQQKFSLALLQDQIVPGRINLVHQQDLKERVVM